MKSFKTYLKDLEDKNESKKLPSMETCFGSHSKKKDPKKLPAMETSMGSHSLKRVNESADEEAYHKHLHKNAPLPDTLPHDENEALARYTQDSYYQNEFLHKHYNGENHEDSDISHKHDANHLTNMLNRSKIAKNMVLHTGVPKNPARYFDDLPSDTPHVDVHLPAFTSTSTDFNAAAKFAQQTSHNKGFAGEHDEANHGIAPHVGRNGGISRHVLSIQVPKGTTGASVAGRSLFPEEREILLNRGHNIRIHRTPDPHAGGIGRGIHQWHAEIIGHDPKPLD